MQTITLDSIMTREVVTATPELNLSSCLHLMGSKSLSCLPIVLDGVPVGIFTERDILVRQAGLRAYYFEPVRIFMTSPVITAKGSCTLEDALFLGFSKGFRHLPVVDDAGRLIGLVSQTDMVRSLLKRIFEEEENETL